MNSSRITYNAGRWILEVAQSYFIPYIFLAFRLGYFPRGWGLFYSILAILQVTSLLYIIYHAFSPSSLFLPHPSYFTFSPNNFVAHLSFNNSASKMAAQDRFSLVERTGRCNQSLSLATKRKWKNWGGKLWEIVSLIYEVLWWNEQL